MEDACDQAGEIIIITKKENNHKEVRVMLNHKADPEITGFWLLLRAA
jgi:hypothetical protein